MNKSSTMYRNVFKAVNWVKNEVQVAAESANMFYSWNFSSSGRIIVGTLFTGGSGQCTC